MALERTFTDDRTTEAISLPGGERLPTGKRWGLWLAAGLIVLAGTAVYWNSFAGVFVFDDMESIVDNATIRQWWRLNQVLSPPCDLGETVAGRPLLNLSLAINYAISGTETWSYHLVNLLLHLGNALLLLGLLRRTFQRPVVAQSLQDRSLPLALVIAGLWTVHPLQTEAVAYIVERAESQVALFYLLTLYCVLRSVDSNRSVCWKTGAVVACLLGMASKETMVTAPVMTLVYDRIFLAGSFAEAWRRRWGLYVLLAATWLVLIVLVLSTGLIFRGQEFGVHPRWAYALTQPQVILHYLRLAIWPHPLCAFYAQPVSKSWQDILPSLAVVSAGGLTTVWAMARWPSWSFAGVWFFGILAPTSSLIPTRDVMVERRMYLSLAAVVGLFVLFSFVVGRAAVCRGWVRIRWMDSLAVCLVLAAGVSLSLVTVHRNRIYWSEFVVWQDTVAKAPHNHRARANYGAALAEKGRMSEAIEQFQQALQIIPDFPFAHANLASVLASADRPSEAITHYQEAIRLQPNNARTHVNLALAMARSDRLPEAIAHYQEAIRLKPDDSLTHSNLGNMLDTVGRLDEALEHHKLAIRLHPDDALAHSYMGNTLARAGRLVEAVEQYQEAIRLEPNHAASHIGLGSALLSLGRQTEALEHFQEALRIKPDDADAHNSVGLALVRLGRLPEALDQFQEAARLKPDFLQAQQNTVLALSRLGRIREAAERGLEAARQAPDQSPIHRFVAWLMATHEPKDGGDPARAVELARHACTLTNHRDAACLDTLAAAYASVGRFDEAVATAKEAWQQAQAAGQSSLAEEIHIRLQLYRDRKPYREPVGAASGHRP